MPFDCHPFERDHADLGSQAAAIVRRLANLKRRSGCTFAALLFLSVLWSPAWAGDWEDGYASYMSGDYEAAFRLFMSAADQGNAQAMDMLSIMYGNGEGVTPNYSEAALWSERAKAQRSSDAIEKVQGSNNAGSNK